MSVELVLSFLTPVLTLVILFGAWLYYANQTAWPQQPLAEGRLYRCAACQHVYVDSRNVPMARCPKCDRFNEAVRR